METFLPTELFWAMFLGKYCTCVLTVKTRSTSQSCWATTYLVLDVFIWSRQWAYWWEEEKPCCPTRLCVFQTILCMSKKQKVVLSILSLQYTTWITQCKRLKQWNEYSRIAQSGAWNPLATQKYLFKNY